MVSLWPFKGDDTSPASFEKALATLSTKIARATTRLDRHRQHARRFKALWTLYTTFAYLLYSIILALVLGWQNWGISEYAAILGGPVLIYLVRKTATLYYDYRVNNTQSYLDALHSQRDETIERLKKATLFNTTQQILEKYGNESPKSSPKSTTTSSPNNNNKPSAEKRGGGAGGKRKQPQPAPVQRTGLPPPPTANIRRPTPNQHQYEQQQSLSPLPNPTGAGPGPGALEPGFAPNAFPAAPQQYIESSHWYDRLLDVLLGEDETQPKNRLVLICVACRQVNGQAPPGVKSLEELGRWRCGSCGAWNGEESVAKKVLAGMRNAPSTPQRQLKQTQKPQLSEEEEEGGAWEPVSVDRENRASRGAGAGGDVTDEGVLVAASEDEQGEGGSHTSSGAETPDEQDHDQEVKAEDEDEEEEEPPRRQTRSTRAKRKG
ncbi:hypothetical protein BO70DRAFT_387932 [Aspergillus heteromorphus CBS 117.55]|uniref:Endoplasmic reticulum junction formation protein lunapark n=1 Tax=Aspergillus heteromorphus CBS 117.55 TaxID=1448321 RepID=A0A317VZJ2_9EURO|nr:uncharacterized protein BO70DRAFT_387932 [Aspergillus heteromorphus CBS 117.55]PWY79195.1 hypothetical protein BO70DRAFT_387932 [Aspergillus heteromorphus CBS 117.55]